MFTKTCRVSVKAAGPDDGLEEGVFEAIVSVFGNVDSYGDVVLPGAFTKTLAEWAESGDPIPVYWSHRMDDPDFNIGHVLEAKETDEGLWVKAQLDLDPDSRKARQVYRLLRGRRVTQFSFAYDIVEGAWVKRAGEDDVYELRELKLYEVGPTPIGANQETELLAVKAAGDVAAHLRAAVKAGRVLSAKNETTLRAARQMLADATAEIDGVLSALDTSGSDDGKAKPAASAKDEEPPGAKSEEPKRPSPATVRLLTDLDVLAEV